MLAENTGIPVLSKVEQHIRERNSHQKSLDRQPPKFQNSSVDLYQKLH